MVYTVEFSADVKATPEQVRSIILDFSKWSSWNTFIQSVENLGSSETPQPGDKVKVTASSVGEFEGVVLKNDESEFSWRGILFSSYIFQGDHFFKFEKLNETTTRFTHGESFQGVIFSPFKWLRGEENIKANYKDLTDGLAKRVEELYN